MIKSKQILLKCAFLFFTLIFSSLNIFANSDPGVVLLNQVQNELIAKTDPQKEFQNITYSITTNNYFAPDKWLMQNPLEKWWGISAAKLPYYLFSKNPYNDFGLPFCSDDNDCQQPHGSHDCQHLNAFYNGHSGKNNKMCLGHSDVWINTIYNNMIQAKHFIDITTIEPFPDERFLATIRNALTDLAYQGRPITVRILEGLYPFGAPDTKETSAQAKLDWDRARTNDQKYLQAIIRDVKDIPQSKLKISVASMRTCDGGFLCAGMDIRPSEMPYRFSGNHAKLIIVDGKTVISGGENLRTNEYLQDAPVHDVSIAFEGPAAWRAHQFVNRLWKFVCAKYQLPSIGVIADWQNYGVNNAACPATVNAPLPNYSNGHTAVMSIGTLGTGMFFGHPSKGDQSEVARTLFFQHAKHTIRISQEDIGYNTGLLGILWQRNNAAGNDLSALAKLILKDGDVYIVTSNYGAIRSFYSPKKKQLTDDYSNNVPLSAEGLKIEKEIQSINPKLSKQKIHDLVCQHLYLAHIRFSNDEQWDSKHKITNHAKIWIIDNDAFYVGSHNMYPSGLQEYGFVIGNQHLTQEFIQHYWDHLWRYSKATAISGKGNQCQVPSL